MFDVGDRVEVQFPKDLSDKKLRYFSKLYEEGEGGTVFFNDSYSGFIGVFFDDYNEGRHDLGGACNDGYGYWVYEKFLIPEEPALNYKPIDLSKILEVK